MGEVSSKRVRLFDAVPCGGDFFGRAGFDAGEVARVVDAWVLREACGGELAIAGTQDVARALAL